MIWKLHNFISSNPGKLLAKVHHFWVFKFRESRICLLWQKLFVEIDWMCHARRKSNNFFVTLCYWEFVHWCQSLHRFKSDSLVLILQKSYNSMFDHLVRDCRNPSWQLISSLIDNLRHIPRIHRYVHSFAVMNTQYCIPSKVFIDIHCCRKSCVFNWTCCTSM